MELLLRFVVAVEAIAASLAILAGGALQPATDAAPAAGASTPQKRGPGRPSTKAADATPAAAGAGEAASAAAATAAAAKAETKPKAAEPFDYDKLKAAVVELANLSADGKAAAVAILGEHNVKKASDAPAEQWPAMYEKVTAKLEALKAPAASAGEDEFA